MFFLTTPTVSNRPPYTGSTGKTIISKQLCWASLSRTLACPKRLPDSLFYRYCYSSTKPAFARIQTVSMNFCTVVIGTFAASAERFTISLFAKSGSCDSSA